MTPNESLAEKLRRRQLYLLRHQASFRAEVNRFLAALDQAIAAQIVTVSPSEPSRDAYRRQRTDKLIAEVSALISASYRDINSFSARELSGLAEIESLYLLTAVNELLNRNLQDIALSAAEATALVKDTLLTGAVLKDWWEDQAQFLKDRFAQEMRIGMVSGESDEELIRRVRGTRAMGFADGLMEVSRRKARILVRGASSAVTRASRNKAVLDNPTVFRGIQQISVLDGRTSHTCISYAGKVWEVPGYKPVAHSLPYNGGTPRHPNCRSTEIPVLREGEPADDVDFDSFLEGKPKTLVDELLGRGRAELYRAGKITLADLVDQNGRPLTLAQLREMR